MKLTPPYTAAEHAGTILKERGYAVVSPHGLSRLIGMEGVDDPLSPIAAHWNDLPADEHLRDGGRYRRRRHASYVVQDGALNEVPHRAHWQPLDYNALHGGIERWFKPLAPALVLDPLWPRLLVGLTHCAVELRGSEGPWHIEAHAFRIDTTDGIGRPTPEGAHRDGVDLVAVILLGR
ncbi:MAG: 2OG-Fe dioxygenase family protein, partial [Planctomycetota bacterium]